MDEFEGNLSDGVGALLSGFGLESPDTWDTVEQAAQQVLDDRGISAEVVSVRYGTVVLAADPQAAMFLQFELDAVREALVAALPEKVEAVRLRVRSSAGLPEPDSL